jgi:hypothetical protein
MAEEDSSLYPNRNPCAGHADGSLGAARTGWDRALWWLLSAGIVSIGAIARVLTPSATGVGTHTQLGLPRCGFLWLTGLPCPACGLTTCFAHLMHGQLTAAVHCQPLGVALFGLLALLLPLTVWAGVRARPFFETLAAMHASRIALVIACALLVQWSVRVARLLLA